MARQEYRELLRETRKISSRWLFIGAPLVVPNIASAASAESVSVPVQVNLENQSFSTVFLKIMLVLGTCAGCALSAKAETPEAEPEREFTVWDALPDRMTHYYMATIGNGLVVQIAMEIRRDTPGGFTEGGVRGFYFYERHGRPIILEGDVTKGDDSTQPIFVVEKASGDGKAMGRLVLRLLDIEARGWRAPGGTVPLERLARPPQNQCVRTASHCRSLPTL